MRISSSHGIAGLVVQSGQQMAISDVASDPRFSRGLAEQTGYVPQTILAVPVETPQRMLGVISLLDRDERRPGAEQDMALLSLFADQAALALASVDAFGALGRVLLAALADAAADGDLVLTLRQAADALPPADADLAALAATFATLARRGAAERRLALAVLRDIGEYAGRRSSRPPLGRCARDPGSTCLSTRTGPGAGPPVPGSPWPWSTAGSTPPTRRWARSTGRWPCSGIRTRKRP
jgi:GAF domain-containing protein